MRHIFILVALCDLFFFSACNKSSTTSPSNKAQFKWTYLGTTFTADSTYASAPNSVATYYEVSGWRGNIISPTDGFDIRLTSFAEGSYTGIQNSIESESTPDYVNPYVVNITNYTGATVSGNFTGTYQGSTVSGTFTNVPLVR